MVSKVVVPELVCYSCVTGPLKVCSLLNYRSKTATCIGCHFGKKKKTKGPAVSKVIVPEFSVP